MSLISFAQFQEDIRLHRALRSVECGFYIDVGANSPTFHSVTKMFYDLGWSGINIEPTPSCFNELVRERPRDINLRLAATSEVGTATFFDIEGTGLSTLKNDLADRAEGMGFKRRSYSVETRPLSAIAAEHVKGDVHFLKIDAEGAEYEVVEGIDFTAFRPWIIVLESTDPTTTDPAVIDWEPKLLSNGYVFCGNDFVNRYYAVFEREDLRTLLAQPVENYVLIDNFVELDRAKSDAARLKIDLEEADRTKSVALEKLSAVTESTSWKLSSPARIIADRIKSISR